MENAVNFSARDELKAEKLEQAKLKAEMEAEANI